MFNEDFDCEVDYGECEGIKWIDIFPTYQEYLSKIGQNDTVSNKRIYEYLTIHYKNYHINYDSEVDFLAIYNMEYTQNIEKYNEYSALDYKTVNIKKQISNSQNEKLSYQTVQSDSGIDTTNPNQRLTDNTDNTSYLQNSDNENISSNPLNTKGIDLIFRKYFSSFPIPEYCEGEVISE